MNNKKIEKIINSVCYNMYIKELIEDKEKFKIFKHIIADTITEQTRFDDFNKILPKEIIEQINKEMNSPSKFSIRADIVSKIIQVLAIELCNYDVYADKQIIKCKIDTISMLLNESTELISTHSYFTIDGINQTMFKKIAEALELKLNRIYGADKSLMYQVESKLLFNDLCDILENSTILIDKNVIDNDCLFNRIKSCLSILD